MTASATAARAEVLTPRTEAPTPAPTPAATPAPTPGTKITWLMVVAAVAWTLGAIAVLAVFYHCCYKKAPPQQGHPPRPTLLQNRPEVTRHDDKKLERVPDAAADGASVEWPEEDWAERA